VPDHLLDFLGDKQTLTLTYDITVSDYSGGIATGTASTQPITLVVTGSNDAPVLAADATAVHSIVERPATTHAPDATRDCVSGSLAFTDVDLTDTHHVTAMLDKDAVTCPDGTIPATTLAALQAAMTAEIATGVPSGTPNVDNPDSTGTGSGSLNWNFSVPDHLLDFLRDGQTLKLTYDITVTDDSGATATGTSSTQPVTLVVTGTNDAPVILCETNPPVQNVKIDDYHQTVLCPVAGTVSVSDADIGDTLTGSVTGDASITYNGSATLPCDADVASLISACAVSFDSVITDGGTTVLHWVYDPGQVNLDFMNCGDTLTINYTAQVNDGHGNVGSQPLTVTLTEGYGSVIARDSDTFIFPKNFGQPADTSANSTTNDLRQQDIASLFQQTDSDTFHHWPTPTDQTAPHQDLHPNETFASDPMQHDSLWAKNYAHLAANDFIIHPGVS
jgi:VCBS repeat-containing protein